MILSDSNMSNKTERRLLAVFAHPDDEVFRTGGTLALLAKQGVRVQVLTATRGQAGSCGNPPLCKTSELAAVRESELRCACITLGLEQPIVLNYQDGHLQTANAKEIISEILKVIEKYHPQMMISFGEFGISGHPDHIAIGRFALEAFNQSEGVCTLLAPAVPKTIADQLKMTQIHAEPDGWITHMVDISEVWDAKLEAIRCHRTQLDESPILKANQQLQRLFLGKEHFRLVASRETLVCQNVDLLPWLAY